MIVNISATFVGNSSQAPNHPTLDRSVDVMIERTDGGESLLRQEPARMKAAELESLVAQPNGVTRSDVAQFVESLQVGEDAEIHHLEIPDAMIELFLAIVNDPYF
jgi:hypothetical protein